MMYPQKQLFPIREFMIWWNTQFPIDYWYRQKHNIAWNSTQHRHITLFDILCDWEEYNLTIELENELYDEKQFEDYKQTGVWLRERQDDTDWDRFFEEGDWEQFDDK